MSKRVDVTKTFLPPIEEYNEYIQSIWDSVHLTNNGPLLQRFEKETRSLLGVDNFQFVTNGTTALQLAIHGLGIEDGDVITTPFSYVATTSAILWERCKPVFVDILPDTFCIDPDKIEAAITPNTKAILAVHVFGNACDVEAIERIAAKHNISVIYDAAHAFGVRYKGKSLLSYGDVSICSFHATKLFHTIEGGAVIAKSNDVNEKVDLAKRFGHHGDDHIALGINGKASEFQAAMGLCNLKYVDHIIDKRKKITERYNSCLSGTYQLINLSEEIEYNYAYYPIIFKDESTMMLALKLLSAENIFPRRYFYPSLNKLPYIENYQSCPVSESIASRILCLPLYADLEETVVDKICSILVELGNGNE